MYNTDQENNITVTFHKFWSKLQKKEKLRKCHGLDSYLKPNCYHRGADTLTLNRGCFEPRNKE